MERPHTFAPTQAVLLRDRVRFPRGGEDPLTNGPAARVTDIDHLPSKQYVDSSRLDARIALHERFSTNTHGWHRWVFDQLDLPAEARILEVGAGPGTLWLKNLRRLSAAWHITLSDVSAGMAYEARGRLHGRVPHLVCEVVDARSIPHRGSSFDAVVANHMLYHITCLDDALSEIRRVLKPGGVLYATTVGGGHMRELGDLVEEFAGSPEQWEDTVPDQFLVEDGSQWLSKWFSGVELRHYEDSLEITEAGPLVAYVLSVVGDAALSGSDLARFTHFVEQRLVEVGSIRVTKETGLLEATKGQR